jgi:hypothetical protein
MIVFPLLKRGFHMHAHRTGYQPPDLLKQWCSQLGPRLLSPVAPVRPTIAMGYLVQGPVVEELVCIEDLLLTVLYDDQRPDGTASIRLAGYGARAIAWGACFGGRSQNKFDKDLALPPERCAHGCRIELTRRSLLEHGLLLDEAIEHSSTVAGDIPAVMRFPTLWAAFRSADARTVKPAGPEFEALQQRLGISAADLAANYRRRCLGLVLLPLEWVSHAWRQWATLFADLSQYPRHQCLRRIDLGQQLRGFSGAVKYDFLASRFTGTRQAGVSSQRPSSIVAVSA